MRVQPWRPEPLSQRLGLPVIIHGVVNSTMTEARRSGSGPCVHVAERQRAGRGRHGRVWESRSGNLHATIVWPDPAGRVPPGVLAAIQAEIATALREAGGPDAECKWPNDGFIGGRKWCGLLAERERGRLLVGIGANLVREPEDPGLGATNLCSHWPDWPGREAVAVLVLGAALSVLRDGEAGLRRGLSRWPGLDVWARGTPIVVETMEGARQGRYAGLDPVGRLLLDTVDGTVGVPAGEAHRVRRRS